MSNLVLNGTTTVCGISVPNIEGGFGEGKKVLLAKDIALLHGKKLFHVNEAINNNRKRFKDGIDAIDLKGSEFAIVLVDSKILNQKAVNASNHIYALSERGYSKLLKIFDDDLAWEKYDEVMDEYFALRSQVNVPTPTDQLEVAAIMIQELKTQRDRLNAVEGTVSHIQDKFEAVKEVLCPEETTWNEMIHKYMGKIVEHTGDYYGAWAESYRELGRRGYDIRRRHENAQKRMAEQGCTKSVVNALTKLQVIEGDKKLRQAYTNIVQEMVLRYVV